MDEMDSYERVARDAVAGYGLAVMTIVYAIKADDYDGFARACKRGLRHSTELMDRMNRLKIADELREV